MTNSVVDGGPSPHPNPTARRRTRLSTPDGPVARSGTGDNLIGELAAAPSTRGHRLVLRCDNGRDLATVSVFIPEG